MKSTSSLLTVGALALMMSVSACAEKKTAAAPPPPTVLVTTISHQDVALSIEAIGNVDGYVNADIRARVRGFLQSQEYKDGSAVKKGQLLFTIDPSEYTTALASAKAALARATAAQTNSRASNERAQALISSGVVSKQEVDNATAGLADSTGQVSAAQAAVQQAELNLSYTRIVAPNDGVAGLALVRVGNLVGQDGPTLLTTVSQIDPVRVSFPISEIDYVRHPERFKGLEQRDLTWVKKRFEEVGDPKSEINTNGVDLLLADGRVYPKKGLVVSVDRQVDRTTGTINLQALFPNPNSEIRPGQYGRVRIKRGEEGANVIAVPEKALISVQGTYSVALVGQDNKVTLKRVELGSSVGGLRVVTSGVAEGDRIIVEGTQKVSDGSTVVPQPAPPVSATPPPPATAPPMAGSPSPASSTSTSAANLSKP